MFLWGLILSCVIYLVPAGDAEQPCPDGSWSLYEDGNVCIKAFSQERMTWQDARDVCKKEKADLVQIPDSKTNDFVKGMLTKDLRYWMGVTDENKDDVFEYLYGEALSSFQPWAYREPNNHGTRHEGCAEIIANKRGAWNDKRCSRKRPFVCQKDAIFGRTAEEILSSDFSGDDFKKHYIDNYANWVRTSDPKSVERGHVMKTTADKNHVSLLTSLPVNTTQPSCFIFDFKAASPGTNVLVSHSKELVWETQVNQPTINVWQKGFGDVPPMSGDEVEIFVYNDQRATSLELDNVAYQRGTCKSNGLVHQMA